MAVLAWILLGLVSGAVAGQAAVGAKLGVIGNIALAIAGAVLAGAASYYCTDGLVVTPVNFWSLCASMTGTVILLVAHDEHGIRLQARLRQPVR
jgi:uncharacterized membrane protein YeaQ/YmgE (transglycosylase-associated protein family)